MSRWYDNRERPGVASDSSARGFSLPSQVQASHATCKPVEETCRVFAQVEKRICLTKPAPKVRARRRNRDDKPQFELGRIRRSRRFNCEQAEIIVQLDDKGEHQPERRDVGMKVSTFVLAVGLRTVEVLVS